MPVARPRDLAQSLVGPLLRESTIEVTIGPPPTGLEAPLRRGHPMDVHGPDTDRETLEEDVRVVDGVEAVVHAVAEDGVAGVEAGDGPVALRSPVTSRLRRPVAPAPVPSRNPRPAGGPVRTVPQCVVAPEPLVVIPRHDVPDEVPPVTLESHPDPPPGTPEQVVAPETPREVVVRLDNEEVAGLVATGEGVPCVAPGRLRRGRRVVVAPRPPLETGHDLRDGGPLLRHVRPVGRRDRDTETGEGVLVEGDDVDVVDAVVDGVGEGDTEKAGGEGGPDVEVRDDTGLVHASVEGVVVTPLQSVDEKPRVGPRAGVVPVPTSCLRAL